MDKLASLDALQLLRKAFTKENTVAVPKRKMSRANTRARRAQWKATAPTLVACSNQACKAMHLPHTVCPECGQYGPEGNRRQVIDV